MKRKLYIGFLLVGILFTFSSFTHALKITSSLIEYNANEKKLRVECKVFIDDFLRSLGKVINVNNLKERDISDIENYFKEFYVVEINGKRFPFNYESSQVHKVFNVLTIKFSKTNFNVKKGDQLKLKNTLLFNVFGFVQSNRMELRFPPYFKSLYFETTKIEDSYDHTF
ncbi:DUF6702 family protein [Tenacibaculum jejuense]|uniref:Uncharacterized protein n=1 Tax=Tenacibaculum jejuense TaxID=584609 RepID=A0A238U455_9FLAO|nr:DUF6702 family protein [Tenacibaculum jejuense]SNR13892.1 protein of unknown function [Tenacibaculum jejuense]